MLLAILLGCVLLFWAITALFFRRPRYNSLRCLNFADAPAKPRVVKLRPPGLTAPVFVKLRAEVKIFNRMNVVMPCKRRVPVQYAQNLSHLLRDPRFRTNETDPIARLFYLYAAATLYALSSDPLTRRQLLKNCYYMFISAGRAPHALPPHQATHCDSPFLKGVDASNASGRGMCDAHKNRRYYATRQPQYKLLAGQRFSKFTERTPNTRCERSYTITRDGTATIKNWADRHLPCECYEITTPAPYKFTHKLGADKLKWTITHTADTLYCVCADKAVAIHASGKKTFTSNLAQTGNNLEVYVNTETNCKIYIAHGKTKAELTATVTEIRRGNTSYLINHETAHENEETERLYAQAHKSRFITGENLHKRFAATARFVPTLHLPTLVYAIETADDFFAVTDNFTRFREIARAAGNLNIVALYSSLNDVARAHIEAFLDKDAAKNLISCGVFIFFIDRAAAPNDAVYCLSKMINEPPPPIKKPVLTGKFNTETVISNNFPITYSAIVSNPCNFAITGKVVMPLEFDGFCAVTRKYGNLAVTSLRGGRTNTYKLPAGATVTDDCGRVIVNNEHICTRPAVTLDVKLAAYQQKIYEIIKNENIQTAAERKAAFIGSLSGVRITASDKRLAAVMSLPLRAGSDAAALNNVKLAIRQCDPALFYAVLADKTYLCEDIWALLISKVIGLRLVRGQVQLLPLIAISGNFDLAFTYKDKPYNFTVRERSGGFTITHNDVQYNNFLQISV